MQLSPANLELMRTRPQQARLYLTVFQPSVVMRCRINDGSISKGAMSISYNNVTYGAFTDVEAGMTLLIGTTLGGHEVGRIRIRSVDGSAFSVSENSNINWQDTLYLTVLKYWEVWPVFPRIIQNPSNVEDVIFYKDYDIVYSNQNSILGSLVCAGPHRGALLNGGIASQYFTAAGTENLLGDGMTYAWEFEGGTPSTYAGITPGWVTWNAAGDYVVKLTVTDVINGAVDVTYRYVCIRDRFGEGSNTPIKRWQLEDLAGSRAEGGYSATFKIYDDIDIDDNAVVIIFSEDWYGNIKQSLGGNATNASDIFFVGYVEKDTIQYDYRKKLITFSVTSITGLMKNTVGFSVSTQNDPSPDTWYKILGLDVRRSIYHYLRWHSTILNVADVQFVGQDLALQYFDADRASLFDAIDNLMRGTLIGTVASDRQGKIWAEVDPQAYTNPTGTFTPVMDISKRDWRNEPNITERVQDDTSYIEYGGIYYNGGMPLNDPASFSAFLACAPGNAPSFRGKVDKQEGLALSSQNQLNQLVGNVFANRNTKYPSVALDMTEDLRNLDIAPQETVGIHINPEDTPKNIALDILGIPSEFQWTYDHKNGLLLPTITFKSLVTGIPGDTILIPVPTDQGDGFSVPGLQIPPLPIFTFPSPSGTILPTGTSPTGTAGMDYIDIYFEAILGSPTVVNVRGVSGTWGVATMDSQGAYVVADRDGLYLMVGSIQGDGSDTGRYFWTNPNYPPTGAGQTWRLFSDGVLDGITIGVKGAVARETTSYPYESMVRNSTASPGAPWQSVQTIQLAYAGETIGIWVGAGISMVAGRFQAVRLSD